MPDYNLFPGPKAPAVIRTIWWKKGLTHDQIMPHLRLIWRGSLGEPALTFTDCSVDFNCFVTKVSYLSEKRPIKASFPSKSRVAARPSP